MKIATIHLFSFKEKTILIIGLILTKIIQFLPNFHELRIEKKQFDRLIRKGFKIKKINNLLFNIDYNDSILGDINMRLRRKSSDYSVFEQVFENKSYQLVSDLFNTNFIDAKNVVDAGANIGLASLFFGKRFPNALILSIEPDLDNCEMLRFNVTNNNIKTKIYNMALWNEITDLSLKNDFRDGQSWALRVSKEMEDNSNIVKAITLEEIIKQNKLNYIDILKIDIEGAEFKLFDDTHLIELLKTKVRVIAMEIHQDIAPKEIIINALTDFEMHFDGETFIFINKLLVSE